MIRTIRTAAIGLATASIGVSSATAATLYWDSNGATPGVGGDGTWTDSGGNWSTDVAGTLTTTWTNANNDAADFRGTPGTVTASGTLQASQLLFNAGGYTLQGSTITLTPPDRGTNFGITSSVVALNYATGTGTNTITSNLAISHANSLAGDTIFLFRNATNSNLNLNGNLSITYGAAPSNGKHYTFEAVNAASTITVNGSLAATTPGGANTATRYNPTGAGTVIMNADNSSTVTNNESRLLGGTLLLGHANALGASNRTLNMASAARPPP